MYLPRYFDRHSDRDSDKYPEAYSNRYFERYPSTSYDLASWKLKRSVQTDAQARSRGSIAINQTIISNVRHHTLLKSQIGRAHV